jgi:hypothetical protein
MTMPEKPAKAMEISAKIASVSCGSCIVSIVVFCWLFGNTQVENQSGLLPTKRIRKPH